MNLQTCGELVSQAQLCSPDFSSYCLTQTVPNGLQKKISRSNDKIRSGLLLTNAFALTDKTLFSSTRWSGAATQSS